MPPSKKIKIPEDEKSDLSIQNDVSEPVVHYSPTQVTQSELASPTKAKLRRKIKTLQQKLRRRETKIDSLEKMYEQLKQKQFLSTDAADILETNFSGMSKELMKSELKNKNRGAEGGRYSDELKKFAMILHFYQLGWQRP